MWMICRFSLCGGGERAYRDALEILRGAGFQRAGGDDALDDRAPFPAAVVADVRNEPEDITRAIFSALREAGLRPVAVSGAAIAGPASSGVDAAA
jgi:hypothetical protein